MSTKIASRDKIGQLILKRKRFKLSVPVNGWLLKPVYEFQRHGLNPGVIVGILSQQRERMWFELAMIRSSEYNTEMQDTIYTVIRIRRQTRTDGPSGFKINAQRIGCAFSNVEVSDRPHYSTG